MSEIIFEASNGFFYEKTFCEDKRCKVTIKLKGDNSNELTYFFNNVLGLDSPFISWENLSYVKYEWDSEYMLSAVQRGRKLYAGIEFANNGNDRSQSAIDIVTEIKRTLPNDCDMGYEKFHEDKNDRSYYYICKTGTISDYINIEDVFAAYNRLGIILEPDVVNQVRELCQIPLKQFADNTAPFIYRDVFLLPNGTKQGIECIVTGLLLGYPLESTAWLIERDGLLPVKK